MDVFDELYLLLIYALVGTQSRVVPNKGSLEPDHHVSAIMPMMMTTTSLIDVVIAHQA